ncbi:hypothetical protein FHY55_16880 [Oceanicola sp. D3]|uniref:YciI family protein n=1 Tax=Oceanicola sp. D3 TaxID=2587163 RepID=UPI00111D80F4|nr:YciI family protein [Oceanicola sp. D3]QDC10804.1 hypothetical protein FHY55_16880 [Oceanicola sp. D3]
MQFALICRDGSDVLAKRLANRDAHLERIHAMKAEGRILDGGAILSDEGEMAGSVVLCDFPDRAALDAYLASEVYATEGIWADIEVLPFKRVQWKG